MKVSQRIQFTTIRLVLAGALLVCLGGCELVTGVFSAEEPAQPDEPVLPRPVADNKSERPELTQPAAEDDSPPARPPIDDAADLLPEVHDEVPVPPLDAPTPEDPRMSADRSVPAADTSADPPSETAQASPDAESPEAQVDEESESKSPKGLAALPYPQRTDPFIQPTPKQAAAVSKETSRNTGGGNLELKGFVNVEGVQALLSVDGVIWAAREGERQSDLRVVKILPPEVTLRRGDVEWVVSLRPSSVD